MKTVQVITETTCQHTHSMQTLRHSQKKPSNCQNQELGENHYKCGEAISLIIYITVFVLFTYLLSKTEISCYLTLKML